MNWLQKLIFFTFKRVTKAENRAILVIDNEKNMGNVTFESEQMV